ncbi:hypothetical protein GJ496_004499 [Pomphorhynchus laevis]|nr:hypothetical protein GJ496_002007 [Pomphorhynchus laevis]KAI0984189.1 hypothetical protein GJ496_004499 [Pomphorhynchus laevis]
MKVYKEKPTTVASTAMVDVIKKTNARIPQYAIIEENTTLPGRESINILKSTKVDTLIPPTQIKYTANTFSSASTSRLSDLDILSMITIKKQLKKCS